MANTGNSAVLMRPRAVTESVQDFVRAMGRAFDACFSDPGSREALRNAFIWDRLVLGLNAPEVQKELVSNLAWLPENVRELAGKIANKITTPQTSPPEAAAQPTAPASTVLAPAPVLPMQGNPHHQTALASNNSAGRKRSLAEANITGPPKKPSNKKPPTTVDVNRLSLIQMPGIGASYAARLEAENIRQGKDLYTKFIGDFRRDQSRLETYLCDTLRFRRNHARNLSDYLDRLNPQDDSAREFLKSPPHQMISMAGVTNNNVVASKRAPGDTIISRHGAVAAHVPGASPHTRSLSRNTDRPPPTSRSLRQTPVVLRNGHLCGGSIVGTNDGSPTSLVMLSNTCPFDSLLQILSCSYLDSPAYRNWINGEHALPAALRLARDMATANVPREELYRQRAALLIPHFPAEPEVVDLEKPQDDMGLEEINAYRRFNCMSSMPYAVEKACSKCPTAQDTISCNSPTCPSAERRLPLQCLSVDIMSSARERRQQPPLRHLLEKLVRRELENPADSLCQKPIPGRNQASRCAGIRSTRRTVSGVHLFIEPLDLSSRGGSVKNDSSSQTSTSTPTPENCPVITLGELPSRLRLGGAGRVAFILRGCVGFSGADDSGGSEGVGHFKAYCLRASTGRWQVFDDISPVVYDEDDDSAEVRCALLVYTV